MQIKVYNKWNLCSALGLIFFQWFLLDTYPYHLKRIRIQPYFWYGSTREIIWIRRISNSGSQRGRMRIYLPPPLPSISKAILLDVNAAECASPPLVPPWRTGRHRCQSSCCSDPLPGCPGPKCTSPRCQTHSPGIPHLVERKIRDAQGPDVHCRVAKLTAQEYPTLGGKQ